jgi:hypothetical protein
MKLVLLDCARRFTPQKYEYICLFAMSLHTSNMPKNKYYTSYTNHMATKEFLFAISKYLEEVQPATMLDSPFFH